MPADIRYALRRFRRSPGFVLIAIVSLALGIGANTAIFSLIDAILLRTLPVPEPNRLVNLALSQPDKFGGSAIPVSVFQQIREKNTVLEGFAAFGGAAGTLFAGGYAERVEDALAVSGNFFETLGVNAILGRVITAEDERNHNPVCVLSYGFWLRRFGGDPAIADRKIQIDEEPFTIVGVTPQKFLGLDQGSQTDLYVPLGRDQRMVSAFGRLRPGVSAAQAQASIDALWYHIGANQATRRLGRTGDVKAVLEPGGRGRELLRVDYERPLLMLMAVVGLVLLTACANVTNLLMARTSGRAKEIAVRLALGAGRARLIRQLLAESALLTLAGAAIGTILAYWADRCLLAIAPRKYGGGALMVDVTPDWSVFLFTLAIAAVVSVAMGIAPAVQSTRPDMGPVLKGEAGVRAPGRFSFANVLVVAQVALSLVLLIGAGLFLRSLYNLKSVNPGFDPERMVVLTIDLGKDYSPASSQSLFDAIVGRARVLPHVVSASPSLISPLSGNFSFARIRVPGFQPPPNEAPMISVNWVGPGYFKTLVTPLVDGRVFTEWDGQTNNVVIVNERTAAHFWPHESAVGRRVNVGPGNPEDCVVVGVVKAVKTESLREEAQPIVYFPFRENRRKHLTLHVRVAGETTPVISALLREIHTLDPAVAAYNVTTMAAQLDRTISLDRLMATLTALFAVLAVVLGAVGLYGVMAFAVAARTREIGIRMALGATRARVLRQVMSESAVLTAIGIALGVPAALWASRGVSSFLFGLRATDPWTYALLAILLAGVALSAAWIPARRAADVDPMVALRYE